MLGAQKGLLEMYQCLEIGSQGRTSLGGPPEQELFGGAFLTPPGVLSCLLLLLLHILDSSALVHVARHDAMGLGVMAHTASADKVKAEVGPDVVHTCFRVLNPDAAVPAKGVLGLSARLARLVANGHIVECLYVVEALQSYPLLQWKRG